MTSSKHLPGKLAIAWLGALAITAGTAAQSLAQPAISSPARPRTVAVCGQASPGRARCLAVAVANAAGQPLGGRSPAALRARLGPAVSAAGQFFGPLGPAQLQKAYRLPAATKSARLAVVDAYDTPTLMSDLAVYASQYNLPAPVACATAAQAGCIAVLNQDGAASPLPTATSPGWGLETSLDIEISYGLCPTCRITLYEASAALITDMGQAEDAAARDNAVISNSYGSLGNDCSVATDGVGYNHPHVAIVAAAGDSGFSIGCPAVLPTVISAGGTTLNLRSNSSYDSESAWGALTGGGTGSGCSLNPADKAQPWQLAESTWRRTGCKRLRGMNDVAADADPETGVAVYSTADSGQGPWFQIGGTSVAAPIIAATYALAGNTARWAYPAQSLYVARPASLHDVATGTNGSGCPRYLECHAAPGYDLPTGVGTPKGLGAF